MPMIPGELLNCAFFLYKNRQDAESGADAGGTGFLVAIPTEDGLGHHYGVTNWHVAVKYGYSCIRLNTHGGFDIFEFDPAEWVFEAGGDDVAVIPLDIRSPAQRAMFIGTQFFLHPQSVTDQKIGPGDDVFMVGRFVDIDSRLSNVPAVRFGNISAPPVAIKQPTGYEDGPCYTVDMHSRTGYSGSPVFVYRTPGSTLEWVLTGQPITLTSGLCALLGIHYGQFPEELEIKRKRKAARDNRSDALSEKSFEEYVEGMSGMTCVIPAWRIIDLLGHPKLTQHRQEVELRRQRAKAV